MSEIDRFSFPRVMFIGKYNNYFHLSKLWRLLPDVVEEKFARSNIYTTIRQKCSNIWYILDRALIGRWVLKHLIKTFFILLACIPNLNLYLMRLCCTVGDDERCNLGQSVKVCLFITNLSISYILITLSSLWSEQREIIFAVPWSFLPQTWWKILKF